MRTAVIGTAVVCLAAGCATAGHELDLSAVDRLQPGVATLQDAIDALGPYNSESVGANGIHVYGWSYATSNGLSGTMKSAAVLLAFGADGKLLRRSSSSNGTR